MLLKGTLFLKQLKNFANCKKFEVDEFRIRRKNQHPTINLRLYFIYEVMRISLF